jgi:pantetheine-phosphate adenylyltransferase
MNPDNRIAVCPGSYDPVTHGHLDIISRASAMFDKVIVAVVNLPVRKGNTLFTAEERVEFVRRATASLGNVEVEPFSILVVDFARQHGAKAIVKGLRAISDFEYELEMNQLNRRQAPDVESVYLMASPQYSFIRSSGVKELATFGGAIEDMVPEEVASALKERLSR